MPFDRRCLNKIKMRPFFHSSPTILRHTEEARSPIPAPCRSSDVQAEGSAAGELVHLEPMGYAGLPWAAATSSPTSFPWGASDPSTNVKVKILSVTVIWQQVFSLQKNKLPPRIRQPQKCRWRCSKQSSLLVPKEQLHITHRMFSCLIEKTFL